VLVLLRDAPVRKAARRPLSLVVVVVSLRIAPRAAVRTLDVKRNAVPVIGVLGVECLFALFALGRLNHVFGAGALCHVYSLPCPVPKVNFRLHNGLTVSGSLGTLAACNLRFTYEDRVNLGVTESVPPQRLGDVLPVCVCRALCHAYSIAEPA
jgi:hypothetical protein